MQHLEAEIEAEAIHDFRADPAPGLVVGIQQQAGDVAAVQFAGAAEAGQSGSDNDDGML
ncbi:hypothetical protein LBMAG46_16210 [Planctomycetia bacterium]|nr:hypothetical protein LBMAG46_16210 [Planctomycetia bacterium]